VPQERGGKKEWALEGTFVPLKVRDLEPRLSEPPAPFFVI